MQNIVELNQEEMLEISGGGKRWGKKSGSSVVNTVEINTFQVAFGLIAVNYSSNTVNNGNHS
jgi:hypothetical protein